MNIINPVFSVIVLYENLAAGIRAQGMTERLSKQMRSEFDVYADYWKFDSLAHPFLREQAARDALNADMIVVSAHTGSLLPLSVKTWIERWSENKRPRQSALVALLGEDGEMNWETQAISESLRQIAQSSRMDFFCHTHRAMPVIEKTVAEAEKLFAAKMPYVPQEQLDTFGA